MLFPDQLEDWILEDHLVCVVDSFFDELDLSAVLRKLFIYGYLNWTPSSWRLELEAGRNVEVMWLTSRLVPDLETIADIRCDNGPAVRKTCAQFVELCRRIGTLQ